MNRRAFLRGIAVIPVGAVLAPLAVSTPHENLHLAAKSEFVGEAFRLESLLCHAGVISRETAMSYMGFARFTDVEIDEAITLAHRWMDELA